MEKKPMMKACCVYAGLLLLNAAPILFMPMLFIGGGLLRNTAPFLFTPILYIGGGLLELALFPTVILLLIHVNYHFTQTLHALFFLDLARTVSLVTASLYSTELYYKYISSDLETLMVGQLLAFVLGALSGLALIIAAIIRCVILIRRRKKHAV